MFKPVSPKPDFFNIQEEILDFWEKNKIFEKSISQRSESQAYSFYDGPPFVTGTPHYGTLLSSIAKDLVPRFWTMKGKKIRRVWGWDCHGLPIENKVENRLHLKNRKDIEKIGVKKFIEECRNYVTDVSPEWEWYINHVGRWIDFRNSYKTMDQDYMETVLWVFKKIYDQGLIYKGKRVSLFCTRCSTPVSNFEIAMDNSYAMMEDPAITVSFEIINNEKSHEIFKKIPIKTKLFALAWTTTPWTLPSNSALAIDKKENYLLIKDHKLSKFFIFAEKRLKMVYNDKNFKIISKIKGQELTGFSYKPLYRFFENPVSKNNFKIFATDFVSMEEGTGIVHMAPGFGEEDTEAGKKYHLSVFDSVNDEGKFTPKIKKWSGLYVKTADEKIIDDLKEKGFLFKNEKITHRYPYCWRCKTPLIYRAQESWFININDLKEQLLKTNEAINWVPGNLKHGRFALGIKEAPDWCISRNRYWATPMPIWECRCGQRKVVGSIKEIEELSGQKVTDLHRPDIDRITFPCPKCHGKMTRVKEVLDCWLESGSMPYGERHYPFENKKAFEQSFPADFISEYVAQTRAWFYVMHVISNALFKTHCFNNVVVTGVIMGTDGRKMSKSYKNYPDPKETIKKYGGDALRLYLMESPLLAGENINVSEVGIKEAVKKVLLPLWNCYKYFITYATLHNFKPTNNKPKPTKILDKWMLLRLKDFIINVNKNLSTYHIPPAVKLIPEFINELSTWYIRRSREKFVKGEKEALETLYYVLKEFIKVVAPIIPFTCESIYLNLKNFAEKESLHLCDYPEEKSLNKEEQDLLNKMNTILFIVSQGQAERKKIGIKLRQPLNKLKIKNLASEIEPELIQLIKEELNVKKVVQKKGVGKIAVIFDTKITLKLREEGEARELIRKIQNARRKAGLKINDKIIVALPSWPKRLENYLKNKVLAEKLIKAKEFKLNKV